MSIGQIHTLPLVQMGHVEKIVEDIQNQPQAQQLLTQEIAAKNLEKEKSQVPEVEQSKDISTVDPDQERKQQNNKHKKKRKKLFATPQGEPDDDHHERSSQRNPWAGIIINKKV